MWNHIPKNIRRNLPLLPLYNIYSHNPARNSTKHPLFQRVTTRGISAQEIAYRD